MEKRANIKTEPVDRFMTQYSWTWKYKYNYLLHSSCLSVFYNRIAERWRSGILELRARLSNGVDCNGLQEVVISEG